MAKDNEFINRMNERIEWLKANNELWMSSPDKAFKSGVYWVSKWTKRQRKAEREEHEREMEQLLEQRDKLIAWKMQFKEAVRNYLNAPMLGRKQYLKTIKELLEK